MRVGRNRQTDKHLPRRMYLIHGGYRYVDRANKSHGLGRDYSAALKRYAELLEPSGDANIGVLIGRYETEILPQRAAVTARGRKQEFKRIRKAFGHMEPKDLKASHAWEYFQAAGGTQQARHEIRALSAVIGWSVKWGALDRNPLLRLGFPSAKPRSRYVSDAEFVAVRSLAPLMIQVAMNIALMTALRQADILGLERRQIVDGVLTVTASKTGKQQTYLIESDLKANIDMALAQSPQLRRHVIVNRAGKPYTRDGFQSQWQRVMRKAVNLKLIEKRFTFHDLRAKNLSDEPSLEEARKRAQHSDSRITQRVYRRLPEMASVADIGHLKVEK